MTQKRPQVVEKQVKIGLFWDEKTENFEIFSGAQKRSLMPDHGFFGLKSGLFRNFYGLLLSILPCVWPFLRPKNRVFMGFRGVILESKN